MGDYLFYRRVSNALPRLTVAEQNNLLALVGQEKKLAGAIEVLEQYQNSFDTSMGETSDETWIDFYAMQMVELGSALTKLRLQRKSVQSGLEVTLEAAENCAVRFTSAPAPNPSGFQAASFTHLRSA